MPFNFSDKNITIQGGVFEKPTTLYDILANRMNILYGRNGSGKSTVGRYFIERKKEDNRIYVFNEDFVDENVKVCDNLKSIIRVGSSAQLDAPISRAREDLKEMNKEIGKLENELSVLNGTASSQGSVANADKAFKDALKMPGGFLERHKIIEGQNCNLAQSLISPVKGFDPSIPGNQLDSTLVNETNDLNAQINKYLSLKTIGTPISWDEPDLSSLPTFDAIDEINKALSEIVRPAELSEEDREILDVLTGPLAEENLIPKTEALIINSSFNFCPLCHQPVEVDYKKELEKRLLRFRDKKIEDFKERLRPLRDRIVLVSDCLPLFSTNDFTSDIGEAASGIAALNAFLSTIKEKVDSKMGNPFTPQEPVDKRKYDSLIESLKNYVGKVKHDVEAYNKEIEENNTRRNAIKQKNIQLAYFENEALIKDLLDKESRKDAFEKRIETLSVEVGKKQEELDSLTAQVDQIEAARDQINHYLKIIFGGGKLRLSPAGKDTYKLELKKGDTYIDIPPKSISSGERNALALAYFFAVVMENKKADYKYEDPTLLVIDDPVSSFDYENKNGVLSLVFQQCEKILQGNQESKVLIMTHDKSTLKNLCESRASANKKTDEDWTYCCFNWRHQLQKCSVKSILDNMDYARDFSKIFTFANCSDPDSFSEIDTIGNTIRQFAEQYARQSFKCRWFDLVHNEDKLSYLPKEKKEFFTTFGLRNVLNTESHGTEDGYSPRDIQRSARIVLAYVLYASRYHYEAYLVKNDDDMYRVAAVDRWIEEML